MSLPARMMIGIVAALGLFVTAYSSRTSAEPVRIECDLVGTDGRPASIDRLPRKFLLVYLGYTHCADLCPGALLEMGDILRELGPLADRMQPVFISIDPERDTPELLARYIQSFDAPLMALTGTERALRDLARQLRFHYVRYTDPSLAGDSFDHSSSVFLIDPGRRLVGDFATELPAQEIASALRPLLGPAPTTELRTPGG